MHAICWCVGGHRTEMIPPAMNCASISCDSLWLAWVMVHVACTDLRVSGPVDCTLHWESVLLSWTWNFRICYMYTSKYTIGAVIGYLSKGAGRGCFRYQRIPPPPLKIFDHVLKTSRRWDTVWWVSVTVPQQSQAQIHTLYNHATSS